MKNRVLHAPTVELAKMEASPDVTVEAEYGSEVIRGTLYTAAHHTEPYLDNPAPCADTQIPQISGGHVLVSHFDLDTVGGVLRTELSMSDLFLEENQSFWELAQFVDLNGPHKLHQSGATGDDLRCLYAFWAWKQENVPFFPRDEVTDVTKFFVKAGEALGAIFDGSEKLLSAGDEFAAADVKLNTESFVDMVDGVIVRTACGFVNHLYATPANEVGAAVVSFNNETGAVTISLESAREGVSCREIVQRLWGPEAGGHDGIAGSPRGKRMNLNDIVQARTALLEALGN